MRFHLFIKLLLGGAVTLLFVLHAAGVYRWEALDRLELLAYDLRLRLTLSADVDPRIVIVAVDEAGLRQEGQWPWPRHRLADLVDSLFEHYRIGVLGFDMVFAEADRSSPGAVLDRLAAGPFRGDAAVRARLEALRADWDHDRRFAASLQNRPVVLGYFFGTAGTEAAGIAIGRLPPPLAAAAALAPAPTPFPLAEGYGANLELLQANAAGAGFFSDPLIDPDGVLRRVPLLMRYGDSLYPQLALAVVRELLGRPPLEWFYTAGDGGDRVRVERLLFGVFELPFDGDGAVLVPYHGRQGRFPSVSAADVLNRKADSALLEGAVVLVGATAPALSDLRATPVQAVYPGVEVNASLIAGILDQRFKRRPAFAGGLELALLGMLGSLATAFGLLSPLRAVLATTALLGTGALLDLIAWQVLDLALPFASAALLIAAIYVLQTGYGFLIEARLRRRLGRLFGQYVPPELVDEMSRRPGDDYALSGENRTLTVLFSDIQGFTPLAERLEPQELSRLMHFFLTALTEVIYARRGTVDKYIGDAVMAFWGAPLPDPEHARHAVETALAMAARLAELEPELRERGWPALALRIGVNSGPMHVGNMGSRFRMAYTVLGDAVNLAARLESAARRYGVAVMISEFTREQVPDCVCRELERVRVKGRSRPVTLYEPIGPADALTPAVLEELAEYGQALEAYRTREWEPAAARFERLRERHPQRLLYLLYLERLAELRANPPGPEWDGVVTLQSK